MKYIKLLLLVAFSTLFISCGSSSDGGNDITEGSTHLRVACVGDSITEGTGLNNPTKDSYPSQLSDMLGEGWEVQNFGLAYATLLKSGNVPYWKTNKFTPSHEYNPDIVVIMLGTNDAKSYNWVDKDQYISDYTALIDTYKNLPSKPIVFICYPPPVYKTFSGVTDSRIRNEVIPKITQVASLNGVEIIDIYNVLSNKKELFPDGIHPNIEGARQLAQTVYQTIY